jgi:hypothetical protein
VITQEGIEGSATKILGEKDGEPGWTIHIPPGHIFVRKIEIKCDICSKTHFVLYDIRELSLDTERMRTFKRLLKHEEG